MSHADALEEFFSAKYVEDYLDFVESLPSEIQRYLTRYREIDVDVQSYLQEINENRALIMSSDDLEVKERAMERTEQLLIGIQEMSDEKIDLSQELQDAIDRKYRELSSDYFNLKNLVNDDYGEASSSENTNSAVIQVVNEHAPQTKKYRRNIIIKDVVPNIMEGHRDDKDGNFDSNIRMNMNEPNMIVSHVTASTSTIRKPHTGHRRRKRKGRTHFSLKDDSPNCDDELIGDPGEPTYCLCDQISFGEMILCDNDLCPHEWFHFSCVQLNFKPKGKWFCPKCRGDKSSVMKSKTILLKALEKYNREREDKILESFKSSI